VLRNDPRGASSVATISPRSRVDGRLATLAAWRDACRVTRTPEVPDAATLEAAWRDAWARISAANATSRLPAMRTSCACSWFRAGCISRRARA
jgi:hypothetical protein